jgi:two-component system sensor histidine kinase DesK
VSTGANPTRDVGHCAAGLARKLLLIPNPFRRSLPYASMRQEVRWAEVISLRRYEQSSRFVRLLASGAVVCCVFFAVVEAARIATYWPGGRNVWVPALVASSIYLPLQVRHVWHGAHGVRPRAGDWTLMAMMIVILGAFPAIGLTWLSSIHALVVSALIVIRPPWSVALAIGLLFAPLPLAILLDEPLWAGWQGVAAVGWRASVLFVFVWMTAAIGRLEVARRTLADRAVIRERLRIDGELRETVGTGLESIAHRGQCATMLVGRNPKDLRHELDSLVIASRRTLSDARQMLQGWQQVSVQAELDMAVALLTAAGVQTRVVLPPGKLPGRLRTSARSELRSATAELLGDDVAGACVFMVTRRNGDLKIDLRRDDETQDGAAS